VRRTEESLEAAPAVGRVARFVFCWPLVGRSDGFQRFRTVQDGSSGGGKTLSYRVFALQVGVALKKSPDTFCGFKPRPPREGSTSPSATDEAPGGGLPPDLHDDELRGQVPALLDG